MVDVCSVVLTEKLPCEKSLQVIAGFTFQDLYSIFGLACEKFTTSDQHGQA